MKELLKHNIKYLSPSSISLFISNPALYVLEKIFGYKFTAGAAAHRGRFIEQGVHLAIAKQSDVEKVAQLQLSNFIEYCKQIGIKKDEYEKELNFIDQAIRKLPSKLSQFGKIVSYQKEIGYIHNGVKIKGYTDFEFKNKDNLLFLDLKTTGRSIKVTTANKIQQYIYSKATNVSNKLFYIQVLKTKENIKEYSLTQEDEYHIPRIIDQAITNLKHLCYLANTKDDFKKLITPNPDDWKWSDDKIKARKEVWGY
jgi:hypothetical protein|tara:strand:- start:279 stop:1040 length:762 start_codon:yes stop_codon:yes gene_type:complete